MPAATTGYKNHIKILIGLAGGHIKSDRLRAQGAEATRVVCGAEARARRRHRFILYRR